MKLRIKTRVGGQTMVGMNATQTDVDIDGHDYEVMQATGAALTILQGLGVASAIFEDETETTEATDAGSTEEDGTHQVRETKPGDAAIITWEDGSSRMFIDNGTLWVSPAVVGLFEDPASVEYNDTTVRVTMAARIIDHLSGPGVQTSLGDES